MSPDDTTVSIGAALPPEFKATAPAVTRSAEELERDREEASRRLVAEARRADNRQRWDLACPSDLRETDWADPRLAPYRPQIDRVLAYQCGAKGIVASGPTGRGKSRSMWQLMRRLGEEGHDVRLYTASDWFTTLQENVRYGRDEARGWVEAVGRRKIVFIDDLGQEAMASARQDWAQSWFFRFLDIRVGERLPLFVTTNLTSRDIAGRAGNIRGDPLLRRLLDVCEPVRFDVEKATT